MTFSLEQAFSFAWRTYKEKFPIWMLLSVPAVIGAVSERFITTGGPMQKFLVALPVAFVGMIAAAIMTALALKAWDHSPAGFGDLTEFRGRWAGLFLAYLLVFVVSLILFAGPAFALLPLARAIQPTVGAAFVSGVLVVMALMLILWLYLFVRFFFFNMLILDGRASVLDSFGQSSALSAGHRLWLFLFCVILMVMNIPAKYVLGLSELITQPLGILAGVSIYRQLLKLRQPQGESN